MVRCAAAGRQLLSSPPTECGEVRGEVQAEQAGVEKEAGRRQVASPCPHHPSLVTQGRCEPVPSLPPGRKPPFPLPCLFVFLSFRGGGIYVMEVIFMKRMILR